MDELEEIEETVAAITDDEIEMRLDLLLSLHKLAILASNQEAPGPGPGGSAKFP